MTCDYSKEEKMKEEDRVGSCREKKKKTKSRFIFLLAFVMHAIKNNYFFDIQHNYFNTIFALYLAKIKNKFLSNAYIYLTYVS